MTFIFILPPLLEIGCPDDLIEKLFRALKRPQAGVDHLMRPVRIDFYADEIGGPHLPQPFVDGEVAVGKQRKGNGVFLLENPRFEGGVPHCDPDQFDLSLQGGTGLDPLIDLVDVWSLLLTMRAIHAEDLDDDGLCANLRDFEDARSGETEIALFRSVFRHIEGPFGKYSADRRRSRRYAL